MDISLTGLVIGDATTRRPASNASAVPKITLNDLAISLFILRVFAKLRCLSDDPVHGLFDARGSASHMNTRCRQFPAAPSVLTADGFQQKKRPRRPFRFSPNRR
ncbi:hypothetical protein [Xanthomonas arboricola]|uniref:Uncharacterized protein n=1 Tax=Xanthomonas arboricola pv. pruni TaxID=69929 RepID=A0ACC6VC35_9XANT|nr:hypothetical protein [Xanthomonas arboricola]MDN0266400.1 hypothetical protein [Xanthomonas arboricola pv. pruni]MDN0274856.1 hypothetical protein [Xanthomonas arboricola pv. pruni]MDN0283139.1 hypothetical protein [Xanthomonas arboricola pv. pruni]MDN0290989.1 hypothetical protein [Xanthomonas arboricola pv. pruni]MDN0299359.1 hypothetical protein [Xanthomonas arboricola pv. pruni]